MDCKAFENLPIKNIFSISLTLVLTDDREIQALNCQFRSKDKPTDVLSFPAITRSPIQEQNLHQADKTASANFLESGFLGEIVISVDTLLIQAKKFSVSIEEELTRLLIHGTLHLLGYEHENVAPTTANKMRRLEKKLLSQLLLCSHTQPKVDRRAK